MERNEPEQRIADALAGSFGAGESSSRPAGPPGPESAQIRDAVHRAAVGAGMSPAQIDEVLRHADITVESRHLVFDAAPFDAGVAHPRFTTAGPRSEYRLDRSQRGSRIGGTVVKAALLIGICVGGAAALTSVFPISAWWTRPFVCRGGYDLAYSTSRYTQTSNRSSTSVHFQCLAAADGYDANVFVIGALQTLLVAFVLGAALFAVRVVEQRRARR